ncbi:MAG: CCA tRNA nucleotidyltransferase [Nitrospirae bacterium]|nr:CCA tRNA nucleotidyltransferase [Nitrospirota bacterium]
MKNNNLRKLEGDIISNPICQFATIKDSYLVGGYIRDALTGKHSKDLDFIIPRKYQKSIEILSGYFKGTIFSFKKFHITRIALEDGTTVDFTLYDSVYEDLKRRDFTINAIAFNPNRGFFDPFKGIEDLKNRTIRLISRENIRDDPVRIIRAYRFMAQLRAKLTTETLEAINQYKDGLLHCPVERITLEFFKLLESEDPLDALMELVNTSVISLIIPYNINQLEQLRNNLSYVSEKIKASHKLLPDELCKEIGQSLTLRGLLYLCTMMVLSNDREGAHLTFSNLVRKRVEAFVRNIKNPCLSGSKGLDDLYDCFTALEPAVIERIIYEGRFDLIPQYRRYESIKKAPLLNGDEILDAINLQKGPQVGQMKRLVCREVFANRIRSKTEAIKYLQALHGNSQ